VSTGFPTVARLYGGPAHGQVLAVPDDRHHLVVPEVDRSVSAVLAEYDPLEAMWDPYYSLGRVTFTEHIYRRERYVRSGPHLCVPEVGLARQWHPWLHQDVRVGDPLVTAWVLSDPPDREDWFHRDPLARSWYACPELTVWLRWTTADRPRIFRLPGCPVARRSRVLGDPQPPKPTNPDARLAELRRHARTAADRATLLYPGPVGETLSRELHGWADFGWRLGENTLFDRLITHLLDPAAQVDTRGDPGQANRPGV
jgi:hypothetical protein